MEVTRARLNAALHERTRRVASSVTRAVRSSVWSSRRDRPSGRLVYRS